MAHLASFTFGLGGPFPTFLLVAPLSIELYSPSLFFVSVWRVQGLGISNLDFFLPLRLPCPALLPARTLAYGTLKFGSSFLVSLAFLFLRVLGIEVKVRYDAVESLPYT